MEFLELQEKIVANAVRYGKKHNVAMTLDFSVLKLYEEMGEFTQALLIHKKLSRPEKHLPHDESLHEVAKELADVVGMAIVNAHLLGIDLEKALDEKWISKNKKQS